MQRTNAVICKRLLSQNGHIGIAKRYVGGNISHTAHFQSAQQYGYAM